MNSFLFSIVIQPETMSSPTLNGSAEEVNTNFSFQAYQQGEWGYDH
jgi:hypothetical protein